MSGINPDWSQKKSNESPKKARQIQIAAEKHLRIATSGGIGQPVRLEVCSGIPLDMPSCLLMLPLSFGNEVLVMGVGRVELRL